MKLIGKCICELRIMKQSLTNQDIYRLYLPEMVNFTKGHEKEQMTSKKIYQVDAYSM